MPFSTSADKSLGGHRAGPGGNVAVPAVAAESTKHARLQRIATALRRDEALWISNKTPVQGSIVAFHDADAADESLVPCFMLPSLPQQATDFIALAGMMDPRQPFFAAYMPSALRHAATVSSITDLAHHYATEIHKAWPSGPIAVGGWSAGPAIALATAEVLRGLGHAVPLLVAIDGAPPRVAIGPPSRREKIRLTWFRLINAAVTLVQLGGALVHGVRYRSSQDASFRGAVRSAWQASAFRPIWQRATGPIAGKVARVLGQPPTQRRAVDAATDTSEFPPEHRGFIAALFDAIHAYVPEANFPGEVVVFESTAEPARSSGGVAKRWAGIATNLTIVPVAGSHMSIVTDPDGRPLARLLGQKLREISAKQPDLPRQSGSPDEPLAATGNGIRDYRGGAASSAG
jgi:thioesterase domain-containing protein